MSCFCKKVFSITLTASYPHRALHPWPHCGNGFCQLPIFQLLSETCWKHPVCPFSIAFSVFLSQFFFPNCLSLQDDLSQAVTHFFSNCPNTQASVFALSCGEILRFQNLFQFILPRSRSLPSHKSVSSWWNMLQRIGYVHMSLPSTILRKQLYRCVK